MLQHFTKAVLHSFYKSAKLQTVYSHYYITYITCHLSLGFSIIEANTYHAAIHYFFKDETQMLQNTYFSLSGLAIDYMVNQIVDYFLLLWFIFTFHSEWVRVKRFKHLYLESPASFSKIQFLKSLSHLGQILFIFNFLYNFTFWWQTQKANSSHCQSNESRKSIDGGVLGIQTCDHDSWRMEGTAMALLHIQWQDSILKYYLQSKFSTFPV